MVIFHQLCHFSIEAPQHLSIVRRDKAILLYALLKGYKMNVGKIIEKSILSYSRSNCRGLIPHSTTITNLCLFGELRQNGEKKKYTLEHPL